MGQPTCPIGLGLTTQIHNVLLLYYCNSQLFLALYCGITGSVCNCVLPENIKVNAVGDGSAHLEFSGIFLSPLCLSMLCGAGVNPIELIKSFLTLSFHCSLLEDYIIRNGADPNALIL
jgi:hypothetical protein